MDWDLAPTERARLLQVARRSIEARLAGNPWTVPVEAGPLGEPCGAFTTLRRRADRELRGCIGFVEALFALVEAVARTAALAATEDHRFPSVRLDELTNIAIDVSALSPPRPLAPEDVEVGVHGLIVRYAGQSGLLLPQVATEHGWDPETFLDQTCRKAGLPAGTWRRPGVELLGFTAIVFGEDPPG